jgi:hypothetical protein
LLVITNIFIYSFDQVGTAVFNNVIRDGLSGKTRILVTHALHFLPHVDYIYTMVDGRIAEQGNYEDLSTREGGAFAKLVKDLAPKEEKGESAGVTGQEGQSDGEGVQEATKKVIKEAELMRAEERSVGSVSGDGVWNCHFFFYPEHRAINVCDSVQGLFYCRTRTSIDYPAHLPPLGFTRR